MKKLILIIATIPLMLSAKAVKVDEILTEKNKLKLDISLSYSNINRYENLVAPITHQTQNGDFVNIPTYLGSSQTDQDYLNYGFTLKYGITEKLELFTTLNLFTSDIHISNNTFSTKSEKGFNSLNFGFTYQVKKEDEKPSLLVGASADLIERVRFSNNTKKNKNLKSYSIFATSYYTVDPVVFLLKTAYRVNLKKSYKDKSIDSGEIFTLSPNIYFAVNPYTSLNWGIRYQYNGKDRVNNQVVSNSGSSVSYLFGASYEISTKYNLNVDYEKKDNSNYASDNITLTLSYKF
jgi:hypothetical protein